MNKYFKIGQNFKFNIYPVVQDIYYHFQIADVKISIRSNLQACIIFTMFQCLLWLLVFTVRFVMVACIYGQTSLILSVIKFNLVFAYFVDLKQP